MDKPKIAVLIPSIPPRAKFLERAVKSALTQTLPPHEVLIEIDDKHHGAAETRNRLLAKVSDDIDFVAFLDDDDYFYPNHLEVHHKLRVAHNADFTYSWFDGNNPFPQHRGRVFDPTEPHHTTMTVCVTAKIAKEIRFRTDHPEGWTLPQEDWRFILDCRDRNIKFAGTAELTWHYSQHPWHTSGLGKAW